MSEEQQGKVRRLIESAKEHDDDTLAAATAVIDGIAEEIRDSLGDRERLAALADDLVMGATDLAAAIVNRPRGESGQEGGDVDA